MFFLIISNYLVRIQLINKQLNLLEINTCYIGNSYFWLKMFRKLFHGLE